MTAVCFDISSGGVSGAIFDAQAEIVRRVESRWHFASDKTGAATLSAETIVDRFKIVLQDLVVPASVETIAIGCLMHNCVLLDVNDQPLTPVFTWLDQRGDDGVTYVRRHLGEAFHERTGCRYHPMFPIFKLASLYVRDSALIARAERVVSAKAFLIHRLTGSWVEDYGMASSSGLFNLHANNWDTTLLQLIGLTAQQFPTVKRRTHVAGRITRAAAGQFRLCEGMTVITGSGDGFLASLGSDCENPSRAAVTLGTSGVARQTLSRPVLNLSAGTFCYKADENEFLIGCASNNGGNVLDWARSIFGEPQTASADDLPVFIPLLHGERSPEWDPTLTAFFRDVRAHHGAAQLAQSVLEGVVFNLSWFVEILQNTSGHRVSEIVLSGNGFLAPNAPRILASVAGVPILMPADPGAASLRGAAVCAFQALGHQLRPLKLEHVSPLDDPHLTMRYQRYKELRRQI
jgi:gluconokinase